jgi:hypothetical protein
MFADLSSGVRNTAETWHQRHQVSHLSHDLVIVTFSAVNVARSLAPRGRLHHGSSGTCQLQR